VINIEILKLRDISDSHFLAIDNPRVVNNRDVKTIFFQKYPSSHKWSILNVVQVRNHEAYRKLCVQYAEHAQRVSVGTVENSMEEFNFGLGDIRPDCYSLILEKSDLKKHFNRRDLLLWMRSTFKSDVQIIEGNNRMKISFDNDDDFLLMNLKFS
jgi:hypothetical protein